jgi:hypothetical protein
MGAAANRRLHRFQRRKDIVHPFRPNLAPRFPIQTRAASRPGIVEQEKGCVHEASVCKRRAAS